MSKSEEGKDGIVPVFIHSSFRTGSTWLWSSFRKNPGCYCYYEVFNEILIDLNFRNISQSASTWNSHHPAGPPYFSEFSPLLSEAGGVAGFDQNMAIADFFLNQDGDPERVNRTGAYLVSLVRLAQNNGRVPVLSCTRSIGRVRLIKALIGGTHILIKRRLLNQWFSYSNQALNHNNFFFNTIIKTASANNADEFISRVNKFLEQSGIRENNFSDDHDSLLIAFICLHLYLYAKYSNNFDIIVDLSKDVSQTDFEVATRAIEDRTGVHVDLSDYGEVIAAPYRLIRDIDLVFIMVRSFFAKGIPGLEDEKLQKYVDSELASFREGYERYWQIAGSAHRQLETYATAQLQLEAESKATTEELAALHQSASQQIGDMQASLMTATDELGSMAQRLQETDLAMRRGLEQSQADFSTLERRLADSEQVRVSAQEMMHAAQERSTLLERDLQQAVGDADILRARLEIATDELAGMARRLQEAELAMQQERAKSEQALAELDFILSGKAEERAELERRWAAMIKRLK